MFKTIAIRNKLKKIKWLTKFTDVTIACDDDQQNQAPKPPATLDNQNKLPKAKRRKWIKKSKYQRIKKQKKRQKLSIVFNYSSITLTPGMEKVLNRGLIFSVTPLNLNLTQVLVDFSRFERTMLWQEFWADTTKEQYAPPIFKKIKTNIPKKHPPPEGLKKLLNGVKSEIEDPKERNKTRPNLPPNELKGLADLIKLQKDRIITIKPCDKGAGVIILDFAAYMTSCYKNLSSEQKQEDGSSKFYYEKVIETKLEEIKDGINLQLEEGFENEYLTKAEFEAMDPTNKGAARFYQNFKVHKRHTPPETPPERPIISASRSVTENIGLYVEHHIKELANKHPSFLQDTPDFLRMLEARNKNPPYPPRLC